jgi:hypothetical protein
VAVAEGKIRKYDAQTMHDDLFVHGYDDMAILQSTTRPTFTKKASTTSNAIMR